MYVENEKKILIICTGGTIAMFPSEDGLKVKKGAMAKFMIESPYFNDRS
jgi:60kDa lysophospholipase